MGECSSVNKESINKTKRANSQPTLKKDLENPKVFENKNNFLINNPKSSCQISQGKTADSLNEISLADKQRELQQMQLNDQELKTFRNNMLELINEFRKKHGANPITENEDINKIAQAHAEKMARDGKEEYSHNKLGEEKMSELIYRSMQNFTEKVAVNFWYSDINSYNERNPQENNFTKLVWKLSTFAGIGVSRGADGNYYCVCNLLPCAGGDKGEYSENVKMNRQVYIQGNGTTDDGNGDKNNDPRIS